MGIGAESSSNLYLLHGVLRQRSGRANKKFKAAYHAKFGDKAPQLATYRRRLLWGVNCAQTLVTKAGGTDGQKCMDASEGLTFDTAAGPATMRGRQVDKSMFLADCKGTEFDVLKTFADVKSGSACKA